MVKSACLGFVADLGSGSLWRIIGRLVVEEGDSVTLAIGRGVIPDLPLLEMKTDTEIVVTVGLARVLASDTVSDLSGWAKAGQTPEVGLSELRRANYRSDKAPLGVDTNSLTSAHSSQARRRTRFSTTTPPEEADDEGAEDGHVKYTEQFAKQFKDQWPEEGTEEVGMSSLRNLFRQTSENVPKRTGAGSSTENPYANLPKPEDRYTAHRRRFQGRQQEPGDNGAESAQFPFPLLKNADPSSS